MQLSLSNYRKRLFNAKPQGPAPKNKEVAIPFGSTYYSNFDSKSNSFTTNSLLSTLTDNKLKKVLDNWKAIHAIKQPKKLLSLLSKAKFQNFISEKYGLYGLYICASYIQECSSFIISY